MLLCWCIGKAASEVKEFYILPVHCLSSQFVHHPDSGEGLPQ